MSLKEKTFSGVRWTTFASLGKAGIQLIQLAVLAHLLSPEDFGLMAIVLAILAFIQLFADAGISNAIIHFQDISKDQLSSLYWLNVSVSCVLALLLAASSYWISLWYGHLEIQNLLMIASAVLVSGSVAQQIRIVAQKELRFKGLAKIDIVAALFGFVVAISFAIGGAGVYALIIGTLTASVLSSALLWLYMSAGWRPSFILRLSEIKKFLSYGGYMVGNNFVNLFNLQIDIFLGARLIGVHSLGLYSVPKELSLRILGVINPIVSQVALPVMAKSQYDAKVLKNIYLKMMRMTASINCPVYIGLAFFSPVVIPLFLGEKWQGSILLLQIFSIYGLFRSLGNPAGSLLFAVGRAKLAFYWNVSLMFLIIPAVWFGSEFGAEGMAYAMLSLMVVLYIPGWFFLVRPCCSASLNEYVVQFFIPFILSIVSCVLAFLLRGDENIIVGVLVFGVGYITLSFFFNKIFVRYILELLGRKMNGDGIIGEGK